MSNKSPVIKKPLLPRGIKAKRNGKDVFIFDKGFYKTVIKTMKQKKKYSKPVIINKEAEHVLEN
jgi:hypothetical protein